MSNQIFSFVSIYLTIRSNCNMCEMLCKGHTGRDEFHTQFLWSFRKVSHKKFHSTAIKRTKMLKSYAAKYFFTKCFIKIPQVTHDVELLLKNIKFHLSIHACMSINYCSTTFVTFEFFLSFLMKSQLKQLRTSSLIYFKIV